MGFVSVFFDVETEGGTKEGREGGRKERGREGRRKEVLKPETNPKTTHKETLNQP